MSAPFDRGIDEYIRRLRIAAKRGMARAAFNCLRDCVMDMPQVPLDEGTLRGSGSAFVDNELVATSEQFGGSGAKPTPATSLGEPLKPGFIRGAVGFNTPYAAYQHEGAREDGSHVVKNYSHSGTGAKFLERKLIENHAAYVGEVHDAIEEEFGGGTGGTLAGVANA